MKHTLAALSAITLLPFAAQAGGLDRSGQSIDVLFETGNHIDLSFGFTQPDLVGTDLATRQSISNVGLDFSTFSGGVKFEVNDQFSIAVIADQPFGVDILYPGNPRATSLGGTAATVESTALTALARYKFNENWSAHGGLRYQEVSADVTLSGGAFGALNGYNANFASNSEVGYVIGGAYERPDIALRIALTYNSEITHALDTVETGVPLFGTVTGTTEVSTPESINLDFQTGIAKDTLLFGSVRYAKYSQTQVSPTGFDAVVGRTTSGDSITDLEDSVDFEIGLGRRFNDKWSGSIAFGIESEGDDNLVSPLAPTNGARYVSLGAKYDVNESLSISGGVRFTDLGDAFAETGTPDVARASFNGNSAVSAGLRVGIKF